MNITLIIIGAITFLLCVTGYRKGMTKVISSLLGWIVAILVITLLGVIYLSIKSENIKLSVVMVTALILISMIYGVVNFLVKLVRLIAKLPVLHFFDRLLGILVGIAEGIVFTWIIYLVNGAGLLGEFGQIILQDTEKSQLLSWLYEYNYLLRLMERI